MSYILNYTKWNALFEQEATAQKIQANPIGSTGIYLAIIEGDGKSYSTSDKPGVPHIIATGSDVSFQVYNANTGTTSINFYKGNSDLKYNGIWKEVTDSANAKTRSNLYQTTSGALNVAKALSILSDITLSLFKSIDSDRVLKVLNAIIPVSKQQLTQINENTLFEQWIDLISSAKLMKSEELAKAAGGVANLETISRALQKATI